jgi:hypothetical protein
LNPKQIAIFCFLSDVALSIWSYFKFTNYDEYIKAVRPYIGSPDFELQIYQVMLQSFTFFLLIFLIFHLVIYFLFWKQKLYAIKYVRFYVLMAAISSILMLLSGYLIALIPLIIYTLSFNFLRKSLGKSQI